MNMRLQTRQGRVAVCARQRRQADRAFAMVISRGQEDEKRNRNGADKVAGVDERPCPQQLAHSNTLACARHHHEIVAGKKLRSSDDDEDKTKRKDRAAKRRVTP